MQTISKNDADTVMSVMKNHNFVYIQNGRVGLDDLASIPTVEFFSLLPKMVNTLSEYSCKSGDIKLVKDVTNFIECLKGVCSIVAWVGQNQEILFQIDHFLQEVFIAGKGND